ncbi:glycosyltransferase [Ruminococcus albus]|uniref:Glycosyltransferase involved in cell wall bisynthesis n=1 Tax=Ruminococcus albus TaxID=1264 RepID=A0A1I1QPI6_RUMAL|nr:glycosyltransferase [Ruminococcus albus]SFD23959.1 Glycosyltransferase involved in cell wall bisynthesis [Ruminococcus albus]
MSLEQSVNQYLNRYPGIKKGIKRVYQRANYVLSKKNKFEGDIVCMSPDDNNEYFFGYYDKSPEDATGRYLLCMKTKNTWSDVAPNYPAKILLIDTFKNKKDPLRTKVIATTHAWNVQQGCMMQWLGPNCDKEIIYNDFRNGKYCSIILNVFTGEERILSMPVYSVSQDGTFALTLDFSRLHRLRPGYGYSNLPDKTENEKIPASTAIWKIDINTDTITPLLDYKVFSTFEPKPEMKNATHKVNHIMISPNGKRFMVLHRWFEGQRKYTRLLTINIDGSQMYNLSDDDMVSHCYWRDDTTIIAFENKNGQGAGYYLMKDQTQKYKRLWKDITNDGHPSYSPNRKLVLIDSYPNRKRMAALKILNNDFSIVIAKVFAPFKYDNDTRCDLHPRWSRDGKRVYFDSVFEGHRGLYMIDVSDIKFAYSEDTGVALKKKNTKNKRIKIVYLLTSCKKLGPTQQTLNIIKNLNQDEFEPILITLNDEEADSRMEDYLPYVSAHYMVKTGKKDIILGQDSALRKKLDEIKPDIIHTLGVFPDYAVSRIGKYKQIHTLRNYIYDDYPAKFGKVKGTILAKLQLAAMKKSDKAVTCSKSLSKIYKEKLGLNFSYIQNGVDVDKYVVATIGQKKSIREKYGIPVDAFIFIYTGQFIERKNIPFLLENYVKAFANSKNVYFLLLGGGPDLEPLKNKYKGNYNIDFRGNVNNVDEFLKACDVYVSTSKSEGLPNGVLEAMASGIPVVLSDIEQHMEIYEMDHRIGYLYKQNQGEDLVEKLRLIYEGRAGIAGEVAYDVAHKCFSAKKMSEQYQREYLNLINQK